MLNEIRELLLRRIDPAVEQDFVAVVDLVADRRDSSFAEERYENELGVAWMSCCDWPGMPAGDKTEDYRAGLREVAQRFKGISFDGALRAVLLSRLTPKAITLRAGDPLYSITDVLYPEGLEPTGTVTWASPEAPLPVAPR